MKTLEHFTCFGAEWNRVGRIYKVDLPVPVCATLYDAYIHPRYEVFIGRSVKQKSRDQISRRLGSAQRRSVT